MDKSFKKIEEKLLRLNLTSRDSSQLLSELDKLKKKYTRFNFQLKSYKEQGESTKILLNNIIKEINEKENFLRAITSAANDAIIMADENNKIRFWNKAAERIFGFKEQEALGNYLQELIIPEELKSNHSNAFEKHMETGLLKNNKHETLARRKDLTEFPVEISLSAIEINGKRNVVAIISDISKRKKAEENLLMVSNQLRAVLDYSPTVIYVKDMYYNYLLINKAYEELFHIKEKEIIGKNDYDIFPKEISDGLRENDAKVLSNSETLIIEESVLQNDKIHSYLSTKFLLFNSNNEAYAICGISIDITYLKETEQNLKKSELKYKKLYEANEIQKQQIEDQNDQLEVQTSLLLYQRKELTSSIEYAKRIQESLLPDTKLLTDNFDNHFIFYQAVSIVSGDFYYCAEINDYFIIAVADCTGHGIPAGFMTMLGLGLLNEVLLRKDVNSPATALNIMREKIKDALKQDMSSRVRDGMDIALCAIHKDTLELNYAGAFNALYIIRSGKIKVLEADKMPIGVYIRENPFHEHKIQLKKGDQIYLSTDGYIDQFDAKGKRKFNTANFKDLLIDISKHPMDMQHEILSNTFNKWKGRSSQIDDVLVMGIKI